MYPDEVGKIFKFDVLEQETIKKKKKTGRDCIKFLDVCQ